MEYRGLLTRYSFDRTCSESLRSLHVFLPLLASPPTAPSEEAATLYLAQLLELTHNLPPTTLVGIGQTEAFISTSM